MIASLYGEELRSCHPTRALFTPYILEEVSFRIFKFLCARPRRVSIVTLQPYQSSYINRSTFRDILYAYFMKKLFLVGMGGVAMTVAIFSFSHTSRNAIVSQDATSTEVQQQAKILEEQKAERIVTPKVVKGAYLTAPAAGREDKIKAIIAMKNDGLNAVVIDIKDSFGMVAYDSQLETVKRYKLRQKFIPDLVGLVKRFHGQGIYVIARVASFEDTAFAEARPELAVQDGAKLKAAKGVISKKTIWRDKKNLAWLDPSSTEVREYIVALSKDAMSYGFDELNYDYMRFPSDGKTTSIVYPITKIDASHTDVIKSFMHYLREQTKGLVISADLFGFTMIKMEDIGIGQVVEDAYANFDYVSPMVYPSHYPPGFMGYKNPAVWPYEVVADSMQKGQARLDVVNASSTVSTAKLRPWLQDFNLGADYTAPMIEKQIKATQDSLKNDYAGYLLWNPSSAYTPRAIQ